MVFWSGNACTIADPSAPIGMLHHGSRKWRDERRERESEGVEKVRRREGEKGVGKGGAGQWLVDILPGPKPQTDREREREGGGWERTRAEARKEKLFYF